MGKIRVLFLRANPFTTTQSGLDERGPAIRYGLQHFGNLVFDSGWAASVDDLKGELEFYPSDVVHFIGRGTGEGIVLPRKSGDMKAISDDALALRFSRFSPRTRLVILDGCYTSEQAKALAEVVDCVIGIRDSTDASDVLWFAILLYGYISRGCSIQEAFDQSKCEMPSSISLDLLGKKPTVVLLPSDPRSQSTTDHRELESSAGLGIDLQRDIPTVWLSNTPFKRRKVFICYYKSLEDDKWLQRLQAHLTPLECEGITEPWDITKTPVDAQSEQELQIAIETAKVIILLVSAEFLASDSIMNNQLPTLLLKAQSGGTTIIPLIVAPCSFKRSKLKDFPPFKSNTSLAKMTKVAAEETLVKLVDNLSEKL
jgi:hypothetical protein